MERITNYHLIEKNGEYYAERILHGRNESRKLDIVFKDSNGNSHPSTGTKEEAQELVDTINRVGLIINNTLK